MRELGDDDRRARVSLAAVPGSAKLVRIAAADAGARAGLGVDRIEDLRLAVDEVFFALVAVAAPGAELDLDCRWDDAGVAITLAVDVATTPLVLPDMAAKVVAALVDEHAVASADGRTTFRLRTLRADWATG